MHGIFASETMELDSPEVPTQIWNLQSNIGSPKFKVEVSSPRVFRDVNMIELGKKLLLNSKLGKTEEIKELMSLGAPFTADWVGTSPLHWAAHFNHVDVTDLLLKAGISRDARNKVDRTPLHIASQNGHLQVVQLLLQYGADVNCKDMLRMTPLHWAAENGFKECVQVLIDYGADVNAVNKFDKTPAKVAADQNHFAITSLIEAAAAMEPSVRATKVTSVQQNVKNHKNSKTSSNSHSTPNNVNGPVLKAIGRRKKIGIMLAKSEPSESQDQKSTSAPILGESPPKNPLELLQAHGITMLEPDNSTTVSTAVESGHTVMLTEAGKLALGFSKPSESVSQPQLQTKIPLNQKILTNGKKVITIRADQLINMTKERKVIIKQGKPVNANRIFQGKLYGPEEEDLLIERLSSKIAETARQTEILRTQFEKKEKELTIYKRQLESIKNSLQNSSTLIPKD